MAPVLSMPTAPACQERWVFWRKRCAHWKIYFLFEQWKIEPCVLYHLDKLIYSSFFFHISWFLVPSLLLPFFLLFFSPCYHISASPHRPVHRRVGRFRGSCSCCRGRKTGAIHLQPWSQRAEPISQRRENGKCSQEVWARNTKLSTFTRKECRVISATSLYEEWCTCFFDLLFFWGTITIGQWRRAHIVSIEQPSSVYLISMPLLSPPVLLSFVRAQVIKPPPMLNGTRVALQAFFEAHWSARFQDPIHQKEPCANTHV